ncbi:MAG: hypothetical protein WC128_07805 [Bacteroidales bacterium]
MFFLGVDKAARYSDYSRLKLDNIYDKGIIRFVQEKTKDPVLLPATARVLDILQRNKGKGAYRMRTVLQSGNQEDLQEKRPNRSNF